MLIVRSVHGEACPMPMVEAVRVWVPVEGGWTVAPAVEEHAASMLGGEEEEAADPPGPCMRPGTMPEVTAAEGGEAAAAPTKRDAAEAGVLSGRGLYLEVAGPAPFRFAVRAPVGGGGGAVCCRVELLLHPQWADEGRRSAVFEHCIRNAGDGIKRESEKKEEEGPAAGPSGHDDDASEAAVHLFTTQVQSYDPEAVIAAYKADPPEVKQPEPRKKRQKGAEAKAEKVDTRPAGTRRSQRGLKVAQTQ